MFIFLFFFAARNFKKIIFFFCMAECFGLIVVTARAVCFSYSVRPFDFGIFYVLPTKVSMSFCEFSSVSFELCL